MDRDDSHWLANATFIERRPLRNGKNKPGIGEQLESEKNCMIPKPVDCGYVYQNLLIDIKMLSEKILKQQWILGNQD